MKMEYYVMPGGLKVPSLGMGTWGMGGRMERYEANSAESTASLKEGIRLGMAHIDTAEIYGAGMAEEIVGKAIAGIPRENIVITSKFWRYSKKEEMLRSVRASLSRLGLEKLDFCLAHRPPEDDAYGEMAAAFREILDKGLASHIGVSNFSLEQIEKLQGLLGDARISAIQEEYNLLNQSARRGLFDYCRKNNILVMAHRPLAKGMLASGGNPALEKMAAKYSKSVPQLALRWLIQQKGVVAIPKASRIEHLHDNMGSLGWKISEEDMAELGRLSK